MRQATTGGRIDSAPTIHKGTVVFGCADGRVHCLRASDGALVWRYLVAPEDKQMFSYQQPESVWPLSGSVMVHDDVVYAIEPAWVRVEVRQNVRGGIAIVAAAERSAE